VIRVKGRGSAFRTFRVLTGQSRMFYFDYVTTIYISITYHDFHIMPFKRGRRGRSTRGSFSKKAKKWNGGFGAYSRPPSWAPHALVDQYYALSQKIFKDWIAESG